MFFFLIFHWCPRGPHHVVRLRKSIMVVCGLNILIEHGMLTENSIWKFLFNIDFWNVAIWFIAESSKGKLGMPFGLNKFILIGKERPDEVTTDLLSKVKPEHPDNRGRQPIKNQISFWWQGKINRRNQIMKQHYALI